MAEIFVAAGDERLNLAVRHRTFEHPETTIRMHPTHAAVADNFLGAFDARGDFVGRLDVVHLDIDDADAERNFRVNVAKRIEIR